VHHTRLPERQERTPIPLVSAWHVVHVKHSPFGLPPRPSCQNRLGSQMVGDPYWIIIMAIVLKTIILNFGADDRNHVDIQSALQLGLHDGGY